MYMYIYLKCSIDFGAQVFDTLRESSKSKTEVNYPV